MMTSMNQLKTTAVTVVLFKCLCLTRAVLPNEEAALVADLFAGYNSDIKPTLKRSDQIVVTLAFIMSKIDGLDETAGTMTTYGWLTAVWKDATLAWNPRKYNNITSINVPSANVWKPEISVHNSVNDGNDVALDTNLNYRVSIYFSGMVVWTPFFMWVTSCNMNVLYFPFDSQVCSIQLMNWVYTATLINYTISTTNPVDISAMENSSDWRLLATKAGTHMLNSINEGSTYTFPMAYLQLSLKRVPYYFIFNIILPAIFLSVLSSLVFLIPSKSGEKMGLSVTLLMSYSVMLLMMADNVPRSSALPIMMYYILFCFLLNALSSLASVVVLLLHGGESCCRLHHHHDDDAIALLLANRGVTNNNTVVTSGSSALLISDHAKNGRVHSSNKKHNRAHPSSQERDEDNVTTAFNESTEGNNHSDIARNLAALVELLQNKELKKKKRDRVSERWEKVANIVDRVLFFVFLAATLILAVTCLALVMSNSNNPPQWII